MRTSTLRKPAHWTYSVILLFVCAMAFLPAHLEAQTYLWITNPSFEQPGVEKVKGWDSTCADPAWTALYDIPGWSSDVSPWDSGVEQGSATDGVWTAFLMGQDSSAYQITDHIIVEGDDITLFVDARNTWQATTLLMQLFSVDTLNVRATLESSTIEVTGTMATYTLGFKAADHPDALGKKLGILFDNVTPLAQSWIGLDNVRATNANPSVEVVNYSFELPGLEKVKGWDGECADPNWAGLLYDIPGWTSDAPAFDSGVESGFTPTEGAWTAFMMAQDTSVYHLTNHLIQAGDEIELRFDSRNTWQATLLMAQMFYLDDAGARVTLAEDVFEIFDTYAEYSSAFKAADHPAAVGRKLGILFDNVTPVAQSWAGLDNIRLINSGATAVAERETNPAVFSLAQNYPNPFNPSTNISYTLQSSGKVRLSVYDLSGREIAVLVDRIESAGSHRVAFSGAGLTSGIYFYKLQTANEVITKKMVLAK